jgi:hypothetical protein
VADSAAWGQIALAMLIVLTLACANKDETSPQMRIAPTSKEPLAEFDAMAGKVVRKRNCVVPPVSQLGSLKSSIFIRFLNRLKKIDQPVNKLRLGMKVREIEIKSVISML